MDVSTEYRTRLAGRQADWERENRRYVKLGNLRLAAGVLIVVAAWLAFGQRWITPGWVAAPAGALAWLVFVQGGVAALRQAAARAAAFYSRGLARLENRWQSGGEGGAEFLKEGHVYAADLDLFGPGSLFELLNTTRTRGGAAKLASWLLAPAAEEEARERQRAAAELRPRLDLREQMALLGQDIRSSVDPEHLLTWVGRPPVRLPKWTRAAAYALGGATVASLGAFLAGWVRLAPFLALLLMELGWALPLWPRVREVLEAMEAPARDLGLLSELLRKIEDETAGSAALQMVRRKVETEDVAASARIARLRRLVARLDWARNQLFAPVAALLLWHVHLAAAIERWRKESAGAVEGWLEASAEFEALGALAGYGFENPDHCLPELRQGAPMLEASGLAHPLLEAAKAMDNDIRLGEGARLLVVSGSNMSGKSTLLRAIGLNAVLAWAGAPVRARRLVTTPLQVGASIRVVDSLQDGRSRFYAEITRLKQLADLAAAGKPLLFLIDELLSGTNSHDRRIGAEAVLRSLMARRAIGVVTTHDLALAAIAEALGAEARNVHFEDELVGGELHFDYRLREGVVKRSNALDLMRSLGLVDQAPGG